MQESKIMRERLFHWLLARGVVFSFGVSIAVYAVLELCRLLSKAPGKGDIPFFSMPQLIASSCVFFVIVVVMAVLSRRRLPSIEAFRAWIDDRNSFGGILQAEGMPGSEAWTNRLGAPKPVSFNVDFRRETTLLALSVVFLAAIFLCPRTLEELNDEHRLDIKDEIAEIEEKIQILEQSSELPDEKVQELKEMLEGIRENGFAEDSAKTYEQLDALNEKADSEISGLRNALVTEENGMEMLAQALDMLSKLDGKFTSTASAEIGKFISELAEQDPELAKLLSELANEDAALSPSELARRTDDKSLTKEQCEKLAEVLRKNADRIKEKLRQMAEQQKKNAAKGDDTSGLCENSVPFDEKSLEDWLNSNCPATSSSISMGMAAKEAPGTGEASRGRGDAPLDFSGEQQNFEGKFKDFGVDGMAKADDASAISRTLSAPVNAEKDAEAAEAGGLKGGKLESESKERTVHPQHRRAVKQFFGE